MKKTLTRLFGTSLLCLSHAIFASSDNVVNVYAWSGIIPDATIQQFEKETGIKVNFSTYDSNEVMFAKLKATTNHGYDVIQPSSYYIDRLRKQELLEKIDKTKLVHFKNLNPELLNQAYDPKNNFSIPFIWGVTGIFLNQDYHRVNSITSWSNIWDSKYHDELMLLDDSREVFSMALKVLGYSANDENPEHIKQAYLKLKELLPNVKIFSSAPISMLIDEDTTVGMVWNGDLYKAQQENKQLNFIYPKDGFVIWVDNFAIPKGAPHPDNAYKFLNFMLRADVARSIALDNNFPTANLAGQKLLPKEIRNSSLVYPSHETLRHGEFQTDVSDQALELYEKYWERLKMGG